MKLSFEQWWISQFGTDMEGPHKKEMVTLKGMSHRAWVAGQRNYEPPAKTEEGQAITQHPQADISQLYNELLFAVGKKWPNETRHQTALRYIVQAENNPSLGAEVAKQSAC